MDRKIIGVSIVIAIIIIVSSTIFSFQQIESSNEYRISEERFSNTEWNNELTRNLPTDYDLGADWELLWSDGSEDFIHGENPSLIRKTVADKEILSTSYIYAHKEHGTYQILIWKGDLVSNWIPKDAVQNIFLQTDAKTEKIIQGLDLIPNCIVAYYDYYGDESEIENELLFSECAKKDFRVRINMIEGEYNQNSIETMVFLSNLVLGKI
ncbi:MAG: hypothetical protein ACQ9CV_04895 [Nitrosopumilus sp.]|jgi:hypothetical protein